MKIEKNKIVFAGVLLVVLLFLISYSFLIMDEDESIEKTTQPELPAWSDTEKSYDSKLEALDAIKEERDKIAPSMYPEHMIDEKGYFNPDYMEYEKSRIVDSIYQSKTFQHQVSELAYLTPKENQPTELEESDSPKNKDLHPQELHLTHQLFFASNPSIPNDLIQLKAKVSGNQVVRKNSRVRLQLTENTVINGNTLLENTAFWGKVSFKPNRLLVEIAQIKTTSITLEAQDIQDGRPGIYLENSLKEEATNEVLGDVVQDVNIAGIPQIRGLKGIFQRHQRNLKVTVLDGHQLLLTSKK